MEQASQANCGGKYKNKLSWAEETASKILEKESAVAARNLGKIPYTAENGVFNDMSQQDICWWTNGFWAGLLLQLYGYQKEDIFRTAAEEIESKLDQNLMTAQGMDHDSGFRWLLTSVANYRLTGSAASRNRAILAANNLAGRFNLAGSFIRAWNDNGSGETAGWAIIDCMMNLPLLYWASEELKDPRFFQIAKSHADTVRQAFVRKDGSVCHIVAFDPVTGKRLHSLGGQGFAHGSAWTRGQSWAIYGFTLSYLHTKEARYLETAEQVVSYFLAHIPESGFLPVDFCQPVSCPWEDSTAAAIAACGLIELNKATGKEKYLTTAQWLLQTLARSRCSFSPETDQLLENGSAAYHDTSHNFPIIYGDYFFTEGILKLCEKETFLW